MFNNYDQWTLACLKATILERPHFTEKSSDKIAKETFFKEGKTNIFPSKTQQYQY